MDKIKAIITDKEPIKAIITDKEPSKAIITDKEPIKAIITDKEIIKAIITDKEIIKVIFNKIDRIPTIKYLYGLEDVKDDVEDAPEGNILVKENGEWVDKAVSFIIDTYAVHNEVPSNVEVLPSKRFRTAYAYRSETLQIFLNGLKIYDSEVTQHSDREFSYPIDVVSDDVVEVAYIKKE